MQEPLPFTEPEWKVPGYTGFTQGLAETYKHTPVMAQLETKAPPLDSFLYTRTSVSPKPAPARDSCNFPERFHKPQPDNLWPRLQSKAVQDSFKPPTSMLALGDERISPFYTSYASDFSAPFVGQERLRSPMRNFELSQATSLKEHYASAYNRVGEKRLAKMISTMRERMSAKLANCNDNAFKMRKLFKMYDKEGAGLVHFEDFRMFGESFGMQLDDDSLLALFHVYDPQGTGYLAYEEIVKQIMDKDYFALYSPGGINNTQALVDEQTTAQMVEALHRRFQCSSLAEMRSIFEGFDEHKSGELAPREFAAACASMGVVLSPKEQALMARVAQPMPGGPVRYAAFCSMFTQ